MNLTPDQLKQNAAAMIAYAENRPIQYQDTKGNGEWLPTINLIGFLEYPHRPAPDPIAPGHNPDKLTVSQVGEGWRLLDSDEIKERDGLKMEIENWMTRRWDNSGWVGNFASNTYRTRLTREELAALDKPKPKWQLPAPPAGQRWHREDFTEADLPEGWRPLLEDEALEKDTDEYRYPDDEEWTVINGLAGERVKNKLYLARTTRPLPSAPVMVPWDFESAPMELKVKRKSDGRLARIDSCPDGVALFWSKNGNSWQQFTFAELLADFVQLDGSPCGKESK